MSSKLDAAIYKLSSAMNNYDLIDLERDQFMSSVMRKNVRKFFSFFENHVKYKVEELYEAKEWNKIVYENLDMIGCNAPSGAEDLCVMLAKMSSALKDLSSFDSKSEEIIGAPMAIRLEIILGRGCTGKLGFVGLENLVRHVEEKCSI